MSRRRRAATHPEAPSGIRRGARIRARSWVVAITIVAIAGTLCGCGRYGRPVRPAPSQAPAQTALAGGELRVARGPASLFGTERGIEGETEGESRFASGVRSSITS